MAFSKTEKFLSSILVSIPLLFNSVTSFAKTNPTSLNSVNSYTETNYVTNKDGVGFWYSIDYDQVSDRIDIANNPWGYLKNKFKITFLPEESEGIRYIFRDQNKGLFYLMYDTDSLRNFLTRGDSQNNLEISCESSKDCFYVKGEYSGISFKRGNIDKNKEVLNEIGLSQKDSIPKIIKTESSAGVILGENSEFKGINLEILLGTDNKKGLNLAGGVKGIFSSKSAFQKGEEGYILDYLFEGGISYKGRINGISLTPYLIFKGYLSKNGLKLDDYTIGATLGSENIGVHGEYSPKNGRTSLGGEFKLPLN